MVIHGGFVDYASGSRSGCPVTDNRHSDGLMPVKSSELATEMANGREPTLCCDCGDRGFGLAK